MKRKWIGVLLGAAVLAAVASGAAYASADREVVLEFGMFTGSYWDVANANSFTIIDQAIATFEAEHPGVRIHYYSGVDKDDYSEWFSRKLLRNETPDVFMVLGTDFHQFTSMGILKDLGPLMERDTSFDESTYFTSAFVSGQYGGTQYALPYETVPTLMFVNQTLLNKEGIAVPDENWTWDDLYKICRQVTRDINGDGVLDQFGTYNYGWLEAAHSNGADLFNQGGTQSYFGDEKTVQAVKFIAQIQELYQGQTVTQEDFNAGKVAFMPLTFAEYRTYKTYPYKIKRYSNFQWDCITMPAGSQGDNISQVDTLLMGISANTRQEQLAWEFLKLLTCDPTIQTEIFRQSQGASVLKAVTGSRQVEAILQEDMDEGDRVISGALLSRVIEEGCIEPQFKKYEQAMSLANSKISALLDADNVVDSEMKILQHEVDAYLQQ